MKKPDICRSHHRGNPQSEAANERVEPHKSSLREQILAVIRFLGMATCEQIELDLGLPHQTVSARISELKRDGWIVPTGDTALTQYGGEAMVYRAATAEERERLLRPPPTQQRLFE